MISSLYNSLICIRDVNIASRQSKDGWEIEGLKETLVLASTQNHNTVHANNDMGQEADNVSY